MSARSGELAMRPLPAVLLDLHEEAATGRLVLRRGGVSKTVDLVDGDPVSAISTTRDETLGQFLVTSGVITEAQHREAVQHAATRGGKLGDALIALGMLEMNELVEQLGKQARHKLVQALRWPAGMWRFEAAASPAEGARLRMADVVIGGLRETGTPDPERLARLDGMRFELTARGARLQTALSRGFGAALVARLTTGAALEELELVAPDPTAARLAIEAMMLCDAVQASVAEYGLGTGGAGADAPPLYDILFDDIGPGDAAEGGSPIELPELEPDDSGESIAIEEIHDEDSGVVSAEEVGTARAEREQAARARQALAAEHQRIQGADHYVVLLIGRGATALEIDAAVAIRGGLLDQQARRVTDPHDRVRVEELRVAYATAQRVLLDERRGAAYDREPAGGAPAPAAPPVDPALGALTAAELMAQGRWAEAADLLEKVLERAPGEPDFHAALGWAVWMAGDEGPEAGDDARVHLSAALAINPDHAAAHDYRGRIAAALRTDDAEALLHLERALELDPGRAEALAAIEGLLTARGELRRYERLLKRFLFRLRGQGTPAEADAWVRLGLLYLDQLGDPRGAAAAAANARRIAPRDEDVIALAERVEAQAEQAGAPAPLRAGWREALGDPRSGAALVNTTRSSGHLDAAFLAAATMVAMGTADPQMTALYEARRVRGVVLPPQPLDRDQWAMLRHRQDSIELGGLIELVAPAIHALAPMTLADSEVDPSQRVDDAELPAPFRRLRDACAALLGVAPPAVYARVELGAQIHVVAADPAVLLAGDDALTAPERPELVFPLVRAMTFLWPGRAVGASRQGRVLRAVVMAVFREASGTDVGADDPLAPRAAEAVARLPPETRVQARAAALRLLSRGEGLNLSLWSRALSRTADRAGLLLCGDIPAAFAGAREVGELDPDLVDFAFSAAHVRLRAQLGLARA